MRTPLISALAAAALVATPAGAHADTRVVVEKNNRLERLWTGGTECEGFTITERYSVRRTVTEVYDDDGLLVRELYNIKFTGEAINELTGGSLPVNGTRRIVVDHEAGTWTESGVLRHVTARGEGIVLQEVGRIVEDLDEEGVVHFSSAKRQLRSDDMADFCAALANA